MEAGMLALSRPRAAQPTRASQTCAATREAVTAARNTCVEVSGVVPFSDVALAGEAGKRTFCIMWTLQGLWRRVRRECVAGTRRKWRQGGALWC